MSNFDHSISVIFTVTYLFIVVMSRSDIDTGYRSGISKKTLKLKFIKND